MLLNLHMKTTCVRITFLLDPGVVLIYKFYCTAYHFCHLYFYIGMNYYIMITVSYQSAFEFT